MNGILHNRRKSPDLLLRLLTWTNAVAVISLAAALCITAIAKPELETFFDRYYNLPLRHTWNRHLIGYIGLMLAISLGTSIVGAGHQQQTPAPQGRSYPRHPGAQPDHRPGEPRFLPASQPGSGVKGLPVQTAFPQ